MAALITILLYTPAIPGMPTNNEWILYTNDVDHTNNLLQVTLSMADPGYAFPALPQSYLTGPTSPTAKLATAGLVTGHLASLQLRLARRQHTIALTAAQAQVPVAAAPIAQGPARVKANLPREFNGKPAQANSFLSHCENYFVLNPMTDEQKIRFALQLLTGDADRWRQNQLQLL
jgi:hypothetical protein